MWSVSWYNYRMEFEYKAVTRDGQKASGVREVASQSLLARELRQEGYFLVSAKEKGQPASLGSLTPIWWSRISAGLDFLVKRVSLEEKMVFARHLALMIRAGFSLNRALDTLARQTTNQYFASALKGVAADVSAGKSFFQSVLAYPRVFPPVFVSMVRVGETSGKLEETLRLAARHLKRESVIKRKIQGASVYPALILCAIIGVGAVMMVFVLPQLALTFKELNVSLPLSTRVLFLVSGILSGYWHLSLAAIAAAAYFFYFFTRQTMTGRRWVNFIFLKLPIFSGITKKLNSARFARTLASLLFGGVSLVEAIKVTGESLTNVYYAEAVLGTLPGVEKGGQLSKLLAAHPDLFPPVVTEMVAVGEDTGSTSSILLELARFFESEVAVATKSMSSVIEPIIMVMMGLAVGAFAVSIIQPIYSMGMGF